MKISILLMMCALTVMVPSAESDTAVPQTFTGEFFITAIDGAGATYLDAYQNSTSEEYMLLSSRICNYTSGINETFDYNLTDCTVVNFNDGGNDTIHTEIELVFTEDATVTIDGIVSAIVEVFNTSDITIENESVNVTALVVGDNSTTAEITPIGADSSTTAIWTTGADNSATTEMMTTGADSSTTAILTTALVVGENNSTAENTPIGADSSTTAILTTGADSSTTAILTTGADNSATTEMMTTELHIEVRITICITFWFFRIYIEFPFISYSCNDITVAEFTSTEDYVNLTLNLYSIVYVKSDTFDNTTMNCSSLNLTTENVFAGSIFNGNVTQCIVNDTILSQHDFITSSIPLSNTSVIETKIEEVPMMCDDSVSTASNGMTTTSMTTVPTSTETTPMTTPLAINPCLNATVVQECKDRNFVRCVYDSPGQHHCEGCLAGWTLINGICKKIPMVIGQVRIISINGTNVNFTPDLSNRTSTAFISLRTACCNIFLAASTASSCEINSFTNGSIVVDFELAWPADATVNATALADSILNEANVSGIGIDPNVIVTAVDTFCEQDTCSNNGVCQINVNMETECNCTSDYMGSRCDILVTTPASTETLTTTGSQPVDTGLSTAAIVGIVLGSVALLLIIIIIIIVIVKCSSGKNKVGSEPDLETSRQETDRN